MTHSPTCAGYTTDTCDCGADKGSTPDQKEGISYLEAKEHLEEVLDSQFPKGECKERGAALMLFAEAMLIIKANIDNEPRPKTD